MAERVTRKLSDLIGECNVAAHHGSLAKEQRLDAEQRIKQGKLKALVATALGLFTAIPAVIAYNRYSAKASDLLDEAELFQEEFIALIEQQTTSIQRV